MTSGAWSSRDWDTFAASAVICLLWITSLVAETVCRFKATLLWYLIVSAIIGNIVKIILIMVYTSYFDPIIYNVYKVSDWAVFITAAVVLYKRKAYVVPERSKFFLDQIMLAVIVLTLTAGKMACFYSPMEVCWPIEGSVTFISMLISCIYFDLYYCYLIYIRVGMASSRKKALELYLPVIWTFLSTFLCFLGSLMYQFGVATFFSNIFWNFCSVLFPIVAIQSNISANVNNFLKTNRSGDRHDTDRTSTPKSSNHKRKASNPVVSPVPILKSYPIKRDPEFQAIGGSQAELGSSALPLPSTTNLSTIATTSTDLLSKDKQRN
ncbi:uncharacterized protein BJ171DRAFT_598960 [Polychytrium aggregatum]|uniref:uncharacterized protein n=1 Tax=Polychytrium aggregatum TaxID=110093 RepID=UPI0022FE68EF|nr:uncharacterized protein BJ171DRAFT_598960 [Polychytrium aggregatum]KAI9204958.1 hypothetical protein BJ171DRAFT_598960 [Polychytrium aggregatum]